MSSTFTDPIPMPVCSVVVRSLCALYTKAQLKNIFFGAGAPGQPLEDNCLTMFITWLKQCNDDPNTDALAVLGEILADFTENWPVADHPDFIAGKAAIEQKLKEHGLSYHKGRVLGASSSPSTKDLASIIRSFDSFSLRVELDRSLATVESDPEAAVTAACSFFEAFCNTYIEDEGLKPSRNIGAASLWKVVRNHAALAPDADMDENLRRILGGLASVIDGLTSLRNKDGSAHGRGRRLYRVEPRHARLAVNAAHALVFFLLEAWEHRKGKANSSE